MSVNCGSSMVFSGYFHFPHQNWPPRYNWNIVESGVKHHNPNPNPIEDVLWCYKSLVFNFDLVISTPVNNMHYFCVITFRLLCPFKFFYIKLVHVQAEKFTLFRLEPSVYLKFRSSFVRNLWRLDFKHSYFIVS